MHVKQQAYKFDDSQYRINVLITWNIDNNHQQMVSAIAWYLKHIFKICDAKYTQEKSIN